MTTDVHFLPWVKQGVGALPGIDPDERGRRMVEPVVEVAVEAEGRPPEASRRPTGRIAVLGPGDVVGIEADQVLRRVPRPDDHNLEPNYLAMIELERPDLPWMFSPTNAAGDRADPWLMLVVVEAGAGAVRSRPSCPCPVLTVTDPTALPDPREAWAFAHAQVVGVPVGGVEGRLADPAAASTRSRILCPTQLKADTTYVACLVPTYEVGRSAGLGRGSTAGTALWPVGTTELPVYDHWRFHTGPPGDFELLAERLHALPAERSSRLGVREVAVEPVAALMQRQDDPELFAPGVHAVPTAISRPRPPHRFTSRLSPDADPQGAPAEAIHRRLKELLDVVAGADDESPIVGPPLYGQWAARVTSLDGSPGGDLVPVTGPVAQTWIRQLNADPGLRMAAGAGAAVVQQGQEALMAEAWRQLGDVMAANRRMRWSRLSAAALTGVHRGVAGLSQEATLRLLAPTFGRLRSGQQTLHADVAGSTLPLEATGAAMARVSRYAVHAARAPRTVTTATTTRSTVAAFRDGAAEVLPARVTSRALRHRAALDVEALRRVVAAHPLVVANPEKAQRVQEVGRLLDAGPALVASWAESAQETEDDAGRVSIRIDAHHVEQLDTAALSAAVREELRLVEEHPARGLSLDSLHEVNGALATQGLATLTVGPEQLRIAFPARGAGAFTRLLGRDARPVRAKQLRQARVGAVASTLLDGMRSALGMGGRTAGDLLLAPGAATLAETDVRLLGVSATEVAERIAPIGAEVVVPAVEPLPESTVARLVGAVEPETAYAGMLSWAHEFGDAVVRRAVAGGAAVSAFVPAMAAPLFPDAMVDRLRDLDPEWVLGGVGLMEPNTVCLLDVNRRFVEAFLAGANHELARELLWRGYPTDLRGTAFPRFWRGPARDISSLDRWTGDIGEHPPGGVGRDVTVVVVKGDLLRRYPGTIVTAELGRVTDPFGEQPAFSSTRIVGEVFRGFLGDDVRYVGLDIDYATISSDDDAAGNGWFVSLQEPHDEARFGLDPFDPTTGAQPARPHLGAAGAGFAYDPDTWDWTWEGLAGAPVRHLTAGHLFGGAHQGLTDSAVVGASLFRTPFRVLLKAKDYLPAGGDR